MRIRSEEYVIDRVLVRYSENENNVCLEKYILLTGM
jgi:hypothetical protein